MSAGGPTRRSTRYRAPPRKYTTDAFAGLNIELSDDGSGQIEESDGQSIVNDQRSDADFNMGHVTDAGDEVDEESDEGSGSVTDHDDVASDNSPPLIPIEEESTDLNVSARNRKDANGGNPDVKVSRPGIQKRRQDNTPDIRRRGLVGKPGKTSRQRLVYEVYGDQYLPLLRTSIKNYSQNHTFPNIRPAYGTIALAYPPSFKDGLAHDSCVATEPYFADQPENIMWKGRTMQAITTEDSKKYIQGPLLHISLLMGPQQSQTLNDISFAEVLDINKPFGDQGTKCKRGWIFDTGGRVLSIAWAPKSNQGAQYLAVAVDVRQEGKLGNPFVSSRGFPASIQIWKINCEDSKRVYTQLVKVICTEWGTCRRLKWSPCVSDLKVAGKIGHVGLLATVWADGYARILDVTIHSSKPDQVFWHCTEAPFEFKPPNSVCSCIEWLSPTDLATGCGNGFVAIWALPTNENGQRSNDDKVPSHSMPYFYHPFSETYILDLACAGPQFSHLLASISASGVQMLTDLRAPSTDRVTFSRSRIYPTCIRYSPHLHGFYTTDDQGDAAFLATKRFFGARRVLLTSATSAGGVVFATSPLHTSILVGTPDGTVTCSNPVSRQYEQRIANAWSQKWFVHEWRDDKDYRPNEATVSSDDLNKKPKAGTARITEGFKAERIHGMERRTGGMDLPTIVYDNEQAITALEWNPNINYGTWAAAGMGSGLVRVEDIGLRED